MAPQGCPYIQTCRPRDLAGTGSRRRVRACRGAACRTLGPEFVHFGLTAKCQLTTALARLQERGHPPRRVGEGFADFARRKQPLTLASPYPLPSERAVINCGPAVNPDVETRGPGLAPWAMVCRRSAAGTGSAARTPTRASPANPRPPEGAPRGALHSNLPPSRPRRDGFEAARPRM